MYEGVEMDQATHQEVPVRTNRSHSNPTPSPPLFFYTNSSDAHSSSEATSFNSSRPVSSLSTAPQQAQAMNFDKEGSGHTADSFQFPTPEIRHTVPTDATDMSVLLHSNDVGDDRDVVPSIVLGYRRDLELDTVEKQRRRLERQQERKSAKETRLMNKAAKPALEKLAATEVNELQTLNQRLARRWAMEMAVSHFLDQLLSNMDRPFMENVSQADDDDEVEPQYGDEGVGSMESGEYMVECQLDTCEE